MLIQLICRQDCCKSGATYYPYNNVYKDSRWQYYEQFEEMIIMIVLGHRSCYNNLIRAHHNMYLYIPKLFNGRDYKLEVRIFITTGVFALQKKTPLRLN